MKKRNSFLTRVCPLALSLVLAVGVLPSSIYAAENEEAVTEENTEGSSNHGPKDQAGEDAAETTEDNTEVTEESSEESMETPEGSKEHSPKDQNAEETEESSENTEESSEGTSEGTTDRGPKDGAGQSGKTSSSTQTVEEFDYDITVTFTKSRGALTDISVTSDTSSKNNKYTTNALSGIGGQLAAGQTPDVVSRATYSSNAILAAIEEAGDWDSVSADLTASLNGTSVTLSSSSGSSESGSGSESSEGSGKPSKEEGSSATVPANFITYTVSNNEEGQKVVTFALSREAEADNAYINMVLLVDDEGKHFMPVDAGSDEEGNANDYFAYDATSLSFTILKDDLTSIEAIFTSDTYGKVHFTADLTAEAGGNEEGDGDKDDAGEGTTTTETGLVQKFLYDLILEVTVADGQVTDIKLTNQEDVADQNYNYAVEAFEGIAAQIQDKTVTSVNDIDVVSGATLSSNAIRKAIANALGARQGRFFCHLVRPSVPLRGKEGRTFRRQKNRPFIYEHFVTIFGELYPRPQMNLILRIL